MKNGTRCVVNKAICTIAAVVLIASICGFDSDTDIFYVTGIISMTILGIYGLANGWFK